jgi:hypothetical protein
MANIKRNANVAHSAIVYLILSYVIAEILDAGMFTCHHTRGNINENRFKN